MCVPLQRATDRESGTCDNIASPTAAAEQEHNLSFTLIALTFKSSCSQKCISMSSYVSTLPTDCVFNANLDIKSTFTCFKTPLKQTRLETLSSGTVGGRQGPQLCCHLYKHSLI